MNLTMERSEAVTALFMLKNVISAGDVKKPKESTTEFTVLQVNKEIAAKLEYKLAAHETNVLSFDLTRRELKVWLAGLMLWKERCLKILAEYNRRPDNHESFSDAPGRKKIDYISALTYKDKMVDKIMDKTRRALV